MLWLKYEQKKGDPDKRQDYIENFVRYVVFKMHGEGTPFQFTPTVSCGSEFNENDETLKNSIITKHYYKKQYNIYNIKNNPVSEI